ncbi:MAG TPA: NFACT RNA binding domain-containing protein [Vicinamibacteria bacterium]|nr:NFACT RNA binding domain-containing protein [Vicinamibacteria bacterium]
MDAFTLDGLLGEIRPLVLGRTIARLRAAEAQAVLLELGGARDLRLWLDAGRTTCGLYALTREEARAAQDEAALAGRARQAVLLFRKHLEGRRVSGLRRVAGERIVVLEAGEAALALRLSGSPALTLAVGGEAQATVGDGAPAWPAVDAPERGWDRLDEGAFARAMDEATRSAASPVRAALEACPELGPQLARVAADGVAALRDRLRDPRPTLVAPGPLERCEDALLVAPDALALLPVAIERAGRAVLPQRSWTEAAGAFLQARLRGRRFDRRRRGLVAAAAGESRRLSRLLVHLERDLEGLPAAGDLRRQAEALLASDRTEAPGAGEVEVPDPYRAGARLRIRVDPGLGLPASADRLFDKARRMERARGQVAGRIVQAREALAAARAREAALRGARGEAVLDTLGAGTFPRPRVAPAGAGGPRHYLTSRGLSILVGRGARENHRLTFGVARPEDVWLHARDVPGAHVIVRDPEGRASAEDLREAAELAAFFSEAARQGLVEVHVTRRKHVRPARGAPGRVTVGHSDTLRVAPRDPEGRLRRR